MFPVGRAEVILKIIFSMQSNRVRVSTRGRILALALLFALIIPGGITAAKADDVFDGPDGVFEMSATHVTIFAVGGEEVIGHGNYKLTHVDGLDLVEGEDKYLDGEYDREQQSLRPSAGGLPPVLISYKHQFFTADGTPQYEESLDARTGEATCRFYNSTEPSVAKAVLKVPADTYSGATQLMMLVGGLRQAAPDITFHSFNCIPDPKIIAWPMYPGSLVKMEMKPDLGWLNVVVAPFVPKVYAWFDPADGFNYVGGQFDRYYKGRHVLMVRAHGPVPVAQGSATPSIAP
jgi:hypothetical protein